jgi:hypothetical protein
MNTLTPKIVFLPHGNIQYSQLHPDKRAWVIENSYRPLFQLVEKGGYTIGFEASGQTVVDIADKCPKVMDLLKNLIVNGQIEPVGSPFTHLMMSNVDPEIGLATLKHGIDAWEKHTGVRPTTGWNPECGWAGYVPDIYREAGFKNLVMDADSFFLSFPEIRQATGLAFDVRGHSNKNQLFRIEEYIKDKPDFMRYLTNPAQSHGLNLIFRSDMMSNFMLWYLMGATEGNRETPISVEEVNEMLGRWKQRAIDTGSYIMPYAEDAEYIGTSAYFYVKQFGQARFFEPEPDSVGRFEQLLKLAVAQGYELATPSQVIAASNVKLDAPQIMNIENGCAWHGGTAKAWANTDYSRLLDPVCYSVYLGIKAIAQYLGKDPHNLDGDLQTALRAVTSAYVSDARWPPAPTSPGRFNTDEAIADLRTANAALTSAMKSAGIFEMKSIYSSGLMETQINAVADELKAIKYFGEE